MIDQTMKKDSYFAILLAFLFCLFVPLPFIGLAIGIYYFICARDYRNTRLMIILGSLLVIEQIIIYVPALVYFMITN